jgi:hypothetical protein
MINFLSSSSFFLFIYAFLFTLIFTSAFLIFFYAFSPFCSSLNSFTCPFCSIHLSFLFSPLLSS